MSVKGNWTIIHMELKAVYRIFSFLVVVFLYFVW